jgi:hypothetical protein
LSLKKAFSSRVPSSKFFLKRVMNKFLKRHEEYLQKKMSHFLFEILEYPSKKEVLYLGLCYCQLSRVFNIDEIPVEELKKCLNRYLVDFETYPWRDYLLELEFFYLREGENNFIKGSNLITHTPSKDTTISIDPRYGFLKREFCQKVYKYWYISQKWSGGSNPSNGDEVLKNAVILFNEGLYDETVHYLEDYLPYLGRNYQLFLYRVLKSLSLIHKAVEKGNYSSAREEIKNLLGFLKDFKPYLDVFPYDFGKLKKDLKRLEKQLKGEKKIYIEPIRLEKKRKRNLFRRILELLFPFKG